jgi:hypothetical protein
MFGNRPREAVATLLYSFLFEYGELPRRLLSETSQFRIFLVASSIESKIVISSTVNRSVKVKINVSYSSRCSASMLEKLQENQ